MTETGKRYGTSLYELAAEEGLTERILAELDVAVNAMQEPGYLRLLMTPSVPKKERCAGPGVCAGASVSCQLLKDFVRSRHSARTACLRKSLP